MARLRHPLKLSIVSTYSPRRCGLANFAKDLRDALLGLDQDIEVSVCALDDEALSYPPEVTTVIPADDATAYARAARRMSRERVDMVLVEHEYGIFGGDDGSHVLELTDELARLDVPYTVTPHTMLTRPTPGQAAVLRRLCRNASLVTMLSPTGVRIGRDSRLAKVDRMVVVPHGAPAALRTPTRWTRPAPRLATVLAAVAGTPVLSTFGLLGPGKAIETALHALAAVRRRRSDVQYVVAGATHPSELAVHGQEYRAGLHGLVRRLGIDDNVHFVDEYLSITDLAALLNRTDVYVTPYRSQEQISSGTLTFAVAAGCPVVSTDYHYAKDLLAHGEGKLVPAGDARALAAAITSLVTDTSEWDRARGAAEAAGLQLLWPSVAARLADLIRGRLTPRPPLLTGRTLAASGVSSPVD